MRVRYRPAALTQLDAIFEYITARNPAAAHRVMARIRRSIDLLADFPLSSKASEIPGIREMPIVRYPYIVFYTIDHAAQEVIILRVGHTSQEPERHLD